jgi:hypothetical protein
MVVQKPKETVNNANMVSTLFGLANLSVVEEEKNIGPNVFTFINDINFNKQYIFSEETSKEFNAYTINKSLSAFPDTLMDSVFLNSNYHLDKKMQHDYLFYKIPKRKRWKEWLKKSESEKKEMRLMEDVANCINYNMKQTKLFWSVLSDDQKKAFLEKNVYPDLKNGKK